MRTKMVTLIGSAVLGLVAIMSIQDSAQAYERHPDYYRIERRDDDHHNHFRFLRFLFHHDDHDHYHR